VAQVGARGRLRQGRVAVRMQVDEPRRDDETRAVNVARLAGDGESADGNDTLAPDGEVDQLSGLAAAVVQRSAADDDVRLHRGVGAQQSEQGQRGQVEHESAPRCGWQAIISIETSGAGYRPSRPLPAPSSSTPSAPGRYSAVAGSPWPPTRSAVHPLARARRPA